MMKAYWLVAVFTLAACSHTACRADDKKGFDKDALVGLWKGDGKDVEMEFTKDGKVRTTLGDVKLKERYALKGDRLTLTEDRDEAVVLSRSATVKKLTATELVFILDKVSADDKQEHLTFKFKKVPSDSDIDKFILDMGTAQAGTDTSPQGHVQVTVTVQSVRGEHQDGQGGRTFLATFEVTVNRLEWYNRERFGKARPVREGEVLTVRYSPVVFHEGQSQGSRLKAASTADLPSTGQSGGMYLSRKPDGWWLTSLNGFDEIHKTPDPGRVASQPQDEGRLGTTEPRATGEGSKQRGWEWAAAAGGVVVAGVGAWLLWRRWPKPAEPGAAPDTGRM